MTPVRIGAIALTAGLVLFLAGSGPVRGLLGDVLVVVGLDALLAAREIGSARTRLAGVGALAVIVELVQALRWVGPDAHWLLHLTVGSTFDPLDLAMYAAGLAVAAALERRWRRSAARCSSVAPA